MRLINIHTLRLEEFLPGKIPRYVILSHTWGDEEPTLQEWMNQQATTKQGGAKILQLIQVIKKGRGAQPSRSAKLLVDYVWVDTCCIDKTSSTELSEAINSMYAWYQDSQACYAYLSDVPAIKSTQDPSTSGFGGPGTFVKSNFVNSRYFRRGWTLQEMLAPEEVVFFNQEWQILGTLRSLSQEVQEATSIDIDRFIVDRRMSRYSVAQKMSWASNRVTTRPEDMAYCLLGIFGVNMPLIYGEGHKAFRRLQEEIIRRSDDLTIFAWSYRQQEAPTGTCLAAWPSAFRGAQDMVSFRRDLSSRPTALTSRGVEVSVRLVWDGVFQALMILDCGGPSALNGSGIRIRRSADDIWFRISKSPMTDLSYAGDAKVTTIHLSVAEKRSLIFNQSTNAPACLIYPRVGPTDQHLTPVFHLKEVFPSSRWSISEQALWMPESTDALVALRLQSPDFCCMVQIRWHFNGSSGRAAYRLKSDIGTRSFHESLRLMPYIPHSDFVEMSCDTTYYHVIQTCLSKVAVIKTSLRIASEADAAERIYIFRFSSIELDSSTFDDGFIAKEEHGGFRRPHPWDELIHRVSEETKVTLERLKNDEC